MHHNHLNSSYIQINILIVCTCIFTIFQIISWSSSLLIITVIISTCDWCIVITQPIVGDILVLLMVVLCLWLVVIRQWKLLLHWKFRLRMSNPHVHVTFKRLSDNDVGVVYPTTSSIWETVTLWFLRREEFQGKCCLDLRPHTTVSIAPLLP